MYGNRWNHPGIPIAYTSQSLSLAALEYLVHVDPGEVPDDLVSVRVSIPEELEREILTVARLPKSWRAYPAPDELADIGDQWQRAGATALLIVPSAVIPQEKNILINPRHPSFVRIVVSDVGAFHFDDRLFRAIERPARRTR